MRLLGRPLLTSSQTKPAVGLGTPHTKPPVLRGLLSRRQLPPTGRTSLLRHFPFKRQGKQTPHASRTAPGTKRLPGTRQWDSTKGWSGKVLLPWLSQGGKAGGLAGPGGGRGAWDGEGRGGPGRSKPEASPVLGVHSKGAQLAGPQGAPELLRT